MSRAVTAARREELDSPPRNARRRSLAGRGTTLTPQPRPPVPPPLDDSIRLSSTTPRLPDSSTRLLYTESPPRLHAPAMEGSMLSAAGLSFASKSLVLVAFIAVCTLAALLGAWVLRTIKRERSARVAAERAAAQSHRLAQSTAAFGHAATSTDAMATAIHEPLHWLRAGCRCVLSAVRRSPESDGRARRRIPARSARVVDDRSTGARTLRSTNRCGG